MGTPITGREILIGLKKAATWGTAVACGANDGTLIISESLSQKIEELLDDSAALAFIQRTDQGKIDVAGNIEAYLRYEGLDVALALIMGTAGTPSKESTTYAYSNSYVMADDLAGLFATIAIKKYIVMIEGRNLILASDGRPERFGFSTTRDVEARSPEEAEQLAIRSVREDETLNRALLNAPADPPRIVVTQSVRVESFEDHRRPDIGYIFYADRGAR